LSSWLQLPETEKGLTERFGILFFTIIFWSFNPLFIALTTFPSERVVVNKERSSGSYHLSAYYLAKTISEMPLILFLPSIYVVIVYWAAGLNGWSSFFGSWFFILCSGFMAQSLGLFISATVTNRSTAITMAALCVLTSMLLGGFYVRALPFWLDWAKNFSFVTYGYDALLQLEFTDDRRFTCNEVASSYPSCNATTVLAGYHGSGSGGSPGDGGVITGADVIREYGGVYPLYVCFLAMLGFSVLYRLLAYLSLRHLHRHAH
jgi:ABC-type multidrug transport system permease subunit